jgi:hypothetical protein
MKKTIGSVQNGTPAFNSILTAVEVFRKRSRCSLELMFLHKFDSYIEFLFKGIRRFLCIAVFASVGLKRFPAMRTEKTGSA